ncbi:MAG: TIGR01777 family oxidoreductase [Bacteroidales bacterium]|nr:TIGR01777 family oxidoreductase [Bacteroidales bacterium]MDT8373673.1 TIGR01777 family oxidoreductase [Bacteroidales bacterium]
MQRVVITGGTGLIGSHISKLLAGEGWHVTHLTRGKSKESKYQSFCWDPESGYCDPDAFREGDAIIHLAGSNIGEGRWSEARRRDIIRSRTVTGELLQRMSVGSGIIPSVFITASGVNYYGSEISERIFTEADPPAGDFLGETCRLWEAAADSFSEAGVRTVKLRTAVVLASSGSALNKMTAPAKAGLVVRLRPGNQYFPWIHIDDLRRVYHKALEDSAMSGPYNAAAPHHVTHDMLMREVARQKRLPVFLPRVPVWMLRAVMGDMSVLLTTGSRISSEHLSAAGFQFSYPDISSALQAC